MNLNQIGGGHFSAIAASSNPTLKRDAPKVAHPLAPRQIAHMSHLGSLIVEYLAWQGYPPRLQPQLPAATPR